jgi:urease accessory protein
MYASARMTEINAAILPALLQLASSALPIGGFGYSSGLEAAVEAGIVDDEASVRAWIGAMLHPLWSEGDARHWIAAQRAWAADDEAGFLRANAHAHAMRETAELRLESEQTGRSLALWLLNLAPDGLDAARREKLRALRPITHVAAHAVASTLLGLPPRVALHAAGWSLIENLALAAVKLVPLGQDAGQRLLHAVAAQLPAAVEHAFDVATPTNFAPMLAILSSAHETQYSRLFRS